MGWILFEALLALAVMLAVVWWTFGSRREAEAPAADAAPSGGQAPPERGRGAPD